MSNTQNLPAGLAGRAAAAASSAPAPLATPAPIVPEPQQAPAPLAALSNVAPVDQGAVVTDQPSSAPAAPAQPTSSPFSPPAKPEPAAEPAVPQVQEPAKPDEQQPEAKSEYAQSVVELAGHLAQDSNLAPAVTYMDAVLKDNGVDVARALGKAADEMDARFIDEHYLKEKLGAKADQVIALAKSTIEYAAKYTEETVSQIYSTAGNEAQWRLAVEAFNKSADPVERQTLAELVNSGDREKALYAARKIAEYGVKAGVVIKQGAPALGAASGDKGLSSAEYLKIIQNPRITPEQYEAAKAARRLGREQGIA